MQEQNTPNKKEALFVLESQPPHLGELIPVLLKMKEYDVMHLCVSSIPRVMPVSSVIATWFFLLAAYKDKVTVSSSLIKFEELEELPEIFKHCVVLTTSTKIYVHMASLNIATELVPQALGYHGIFQRTAYRQGRALDYLISHGARAGKYTPQEMEKQKRV